MQLTVNIPDEMAERVLEAFGAPKMNTAIHDGPYEPATKELVEERLQNYVRQQLYAYEDNRNSVQTMRQRSEEKW